MTQEYIITEETATRIERHYNAGSKIPYLRYRPHPPEPEHGRWRDTEDTQGCGCNTEAGYRLGYAAGKKEAARAATLAAYSKVLEDCCKECPIKEEIPVEDHCAESCEGCLVCKTVNTLRQQAGDPHE